ARRLLSSIGGGFSTGGGCLIRDVSRKIGVWGMCENNKVLVIDDQGGSRDLQIILSFLGEICVFLNTDELPTHMADKPAGGDYALTLIDAATFARHPTLLAKLHGWNDEMAV